MDHEEQTRWLINYLEKRFERVEHRIDEALAEQASDLKEIKKEVEQAEITTAKLSAQIGYIRNTLVLLIPGVLSFLGWLLNNFWNK